MAKTKKRLVTKLESEHETEKTLYLDIEKIEQNPTPKYDAKGNEVKKYFAIGGAKYIEELAEALRQDWFYNVPIEHWKKEYTNRARLLIRKKLTKEWSSDKGNTSPWNDTTLTLHFPEFLRYPGMQTTKFIETQRINMEKALQAKADKFREKTQSQSKAITKLVELSPEPPKEPEPEITSGGISLGPSKYQKQGEEGKSPLTKMGDIREACHDLWTALTNKKNMPHPDEDLIVDHIKPTREYRKFVYELDENEKTGLHNWLTFTEAAISDMLEIIAEADEK